MVGSHATYAQQWIPQPTSKVRTRPVTAPTTIHLPPLQPLLKHALRHVLESAVVPLGLFYVLLQLVGLNGGLFAALGWSVAALLWRVARRQPVPAVLLLMTGLFVGRTALGYVTEDVVLYFLQPTLQNFLIAAVLLGSASLRRPFISKLASDFCALPDELTGHPKVRRFFRRVSLLWALVFVTNGAVTLWMLLSATLEQFLAMSTAGSYITVALAAAVSLLWFRRSLRSEGIRVCLVGKRSLIPGSPPQRYPAAAGG